MHRILTIILLLVLSSAGRTQADKVYWIYLKDRGFAASGEMTEALDEAELILAPRAKLRRAKVMPHRLCDDCDLPVNAGYVGVLEASGVSPRVVSKYLNAVSAELSLQTLEAVEALPFVERIVPVARRYPVFVPPEEPHPWRTLQDSTFYGPSYNQAAMVNLPPVHGMNYDGSGVLVGSCDAGWNNLEHQCFNQLDIVATWDFVNGDPNVDDEEGQAGSGWHGTKTLSVLAGYDPGNLVGPAFAASYILAKTENTDFEEPIEEDWWVAGVEWMDSLGVEVISSSVGYTDWYEYEDLDGQTAVTSIAANIAFSHGIVMVNSMGNNGMASYPDNKMGAPADAPGVISCGAVGVTGYRASFSSMGPAYDGRIKPDGMAQGSSVWTASHTNIISYQSGSGTSYSCPMTAGICALMLQANYSLCPQDIQDILRSTADRAQTPDTLYGWGIWDALAAVQTALSYQSVEGGYPIPGKICINAYPNPFNDRLKIVIGGMEEILEVKIYDITGRLAAGFIAEPPVWSAEWQPMNQASGVYFLQIPGRRELDKRVIYLK